jgi:cytochrome c553
MSNAGFAQSGVGSSAASLFDGLPAWAFLWDPNVKVPPPDDKPNPLQGSNAAFSWKQARDLFFAPDWHPDDHSAMPEIVASGRKPDVRACGSCHRVEGTGGPENASLAGLPVSYFVQQLADFKSGARKMSGPERPSTQFMMASAKGITEAEVLAAAEYFAALMPKRIIKVVESETIPKTGPSRLFFVKSPEGGTEPLDHTICGEAAETILEKGRSAPGTTLFELLAAIHRLKRQLDTLFDSHDVILTPATAALPWPADQPYPKKYDQ